MATLFGNIGEFDETQEEWKQYAERLDHFFAANGVTDETRKRAIFLSVVGPKTYKLLSSLIAPTKPGDKSYVDLVKALTNHHNPPPSETVQRYRFHSRFRQPGETISTYVSELRAIARNCNFGTVLEDMLRDRLVCGVKDDRIQRRLLSESKLTFEKALELALGQEVASKNVAELHDAAGTGTALPVNKVTPGGSGRSSATNRCYRCGNSNHSASQCKFKDSTCHNCGKVGHIRKTCRSKPKDREGKKGSKQKKNSVRRLQEEQDEEESSSNGEEEYKLLQVRARKRSKPLELNLELESKPIVMELDTGASVSLVSEAAQWPKARLQESRARLCTYSGERLPVLGELLVNVKYRGQEKQLPLVVLKGDGPNLFGRNWLEELRLDWEEIHRIQGTALQDVLSKHEVVFKDELGKMKDYKAKIYVDSDVEPKFCKARPVPYAMKGKVEEELERLKREGIIEPVQHAEWAAPIVPVMKSDGKSVRMCGDFKLTANRASKVDRYPIPRVEDLFATLAGGKTFTTLDMSQAYQQLVLEEGSRNVVVINTHRGLFRYT